MLTRRWSSVLLIVLAFLVSPLCLAQPEQTRINLQVEGATVGSVGKMIAAAAGVEVRIEEDIGQRTVEKFVLKDATAQQALEELCRASGLHLTRQDDVYCIVAEQPQEQVQPLGESLMIDDMEGDPGTRWRDVRGNNGLDLVPDNEIVKQGETSGKWDPEVAARYIVNSQIPHDWTGYDSIAMWIHSEKATGAVMALVLYSDSPATDKWDYYRALVEIDWEGWRELRFYECSFRKAYEAAGFTKIDSVRLAFEGWPGLTRYEPGTVLRLDDVRLMPDEPPGHKLVLFHPDTNARALTPLIAAKEPTRTGERVAEWTDTVLRTSFYLRTVASDWTQYNYLNMWVHCAKPDGSEVLLFLETINPTTDRQDSFQKKIALDWEGWKLFSFAKTDFLAQRQPNWAKIDVLRFYSAGYPLKAGEGTTLCFDDIWLSSEPPQDAQEQ